MNEHNIDTERIKQLLNRHWKLRYELVGEQSVNDLVRAIEEGRSSDELFQRFEGGADFDLSQALQVLSLAATFLKTCIEVYNLLRSKKGKKPTVAELEAEVRTTTNFDRIKQTLTKRRFLGILGDIIG